MKLKQILNSVESLKWLSEQKLSAKTSWRLAILMKRIDEKIRTFEKVRKEKRAEYLKDYDKVADERLKEYGEEIKGSSGQYRIPEDKREEYKEIMETLQKAHKEDIDKFKKEMEELVDVDEDIKIPNITTNDLEKTLKDGIEPKHLIQLDWLIKESSEK